MKNYILVFVLHLCVAMLASCTLFQLSTETTPETAKAESTALQTEPETTEPESSAMQTEPETTEPESSAMQTEPETEPPIPKKQVAITFDDGPSRQGLTQKLVDEFAKYGGKATFFVLGNLISPTTGEALSYAHEHGFEIGIHAYTHELYFDNCSETDFLNEINLTKQAIEKYIDTEVTLLRAPGGRIPSTRAVLSGYPIINWSIDTRDWQYKSRSDAETIRQNVNTIVENALKNIEDGDIILMHEIYTNSYEAVCIILQRLDEMGFEFVTVTELLGTENLKAGNYIYSQNNIYSQP